MIYVTSVKLNEDWLVMQNGSTCKLNATVTPSNATNKSLLWLSSCPTVASVCNGVVTANEEGLALISASSTDGSGKIGTRAVRVTNDVLVFVIELDASSLNMSVGDGYMLKETIYPKNATNQVLTWESDDTMVATVDPDDGFVMAHGKGNATIRATANDGSGVFAECEVTVEAPIPVKGVEICPEKVELSVGDTYELFTQFKPLNASDRGLTWESSDESVVSVGKCSGKIIAHKVGTATITVTSHDGNFKAKRKVTVNPLLIYQTRDTEVKWFDPDTANATEETREDMLYNHWSKQEIKQNVSSIDDDMFEKNGQEISISDRKKSLVDMTTTYFANKTFEPIIKDMIDHFMREKDDNFYGMCDGYNLYANSNLTQQVKNHSESDDYIINNKTALDRCLKNFNGNICDLKYDPAIRYDKELRKSHPFVMMADSLEIKLPVFDDIAKGFKICIDSLQGAKIEILSYYLVGNSYSGTMKITYYDHFGLDVADLNKDGINGIVGNMNGFKNWFILQHYNDLTTNNHPKPFVTVIEIEESFSGRI